MSSSLSINVLVDLPKETRERKKGTMTQAKAGEGQREDWLFQHGRAG